MGDEGNTAFGDRMRLKREGYPCSRCGDRTHAATGAHTCDGIGSFDMLKVDPTGCDVTGLCTICRICERCEKIRAERQAEQAEVQVEVDKITKIVERAMFISLKHEMNVPQGDLFDAITEVHEGGCPLRLDDLLEASDFNFGHDVFGIMKHLDPGSGGCMGSFLPRYAA